MHILEKTLQEFIDTAGFTDRLRQAVTHSQMPPGKMIRGLLALSLCEDLGGDYIKLLPAAAAIELLHTSSLIHDDLPAMDNDDMRRGRSSCHKAFDEATAILAGDALVALAHNILTHLDFSADKKILFLAKLSRAYLDLCNGQELDLQGACDSLTLQRIHNLKTAALFATCMEFGALGAGVDEGAVTAAAKAGRIVGLSFQIVDDFLDNFANEKGRKAGSDKKNEKRTFDGVEDFESVQSLLDIELQKVDLALRELIGFTNFAGSDPKKVLLKTYPLILAVWEKVRSLTPPK